jgi:hypothetical protein
MKVRIFLVLSLALNLYLIFVAFRRHDKKSEPVTVAVGAAVVREVSKPSSTNTVSKRFNWQSVETDDYTSYIANLRAIGCPEETIADVCKMFEMKKREARKLAPKIDYWRTNSRFLGSLQSQCADLDYKLRQPIDAERNAVLRNLGIDPANHNLPRGTFDAGDYLLDFLSDEKRDRIRVLQAKQAEDWEAIRANTSQDNLTAAFQKQERDADRRIKELLTPEEALQYDLRYSHTADVLRRTLSGFEPTEQEFVQLFQIRRAYEAKVAEDNMPVEDAEAAKQWMNDQVKATLGETRYADYDRTDDYGFQQIWSVADKVGLSNLISDFVHDAIIANTNAPIAFRPTKFPATDRSRVGRESLDCHNHPIVDIDERRWGSFSAERLN